MQLGGGAQAYWYKISRQRTLFWSLVAIAIVASACSGGSSSSAGESVYDGSDEPVLKAVAYERPSMALAEPTDPVLATHGDLLFSETDLASGYVDGDDWCSNRTNKCVKVTGDDPLLFGGIELSEFVLYPDYEIRGSSLEVSELRALHHPVADRLRLVVDVEVSGEQLGSLYDTVTVTNGDVSADAYLVGPGVTQAGATNHYEIDVLEELPPGPTEVVIALSDGVADGRTEEVAIELTVPSLEVERTDVDLEAKTNTAVYRSSASLDGDGDSDKGGDDLLAELITAIVKDGDPTDFVEPDSPGAGAVAALIGNDDVVKFRHDPDDATTLCWQTVYRGTFCERWHGGRVDDDVLVSWMIEQVPIEELVVARNGSVPNSSVTYVRAPIGDVILGQAEVTNNGAETIRAYFGDPVIQGDDIAFDPIYGRGDFDVEPGQTQKAGVLVDGSNFDFDLIYHDSYPLEEHEIRFAADAEAPAPGAGSRPEPSKTTSTPTGEFSTQSSRLASLLHAGRFDEAAGEAGAGSPAAEFLQTSAATFADTFIYLTDGGEGPGTTKVCLQDNGVECSDLEVTEVDENGAITRFSIDGFDVEDLTVCCLNEQIGGFDATVERAILWPKWGVFVEWSIKNESEGDVYLEEVNMVGAGGVTVKARPSVFEELRPGRTVPGVSRFDVESLDGVIEWYLRGREAVREASITIAIGEPIEGIESEVENEATETTFVTRGGTTLLLPGDWGEMLWMDEETLTVPGAGTPLGPVKSVRRREVMLLSFSPQFSPSALSTEELVAQVGAFVDLSDVEVEPATLGGGEIEMFVGDGDLAGTQSRYLIVPGAEELIMLVAEAPLSDESANLMLDTADALVDQLDMREAE